MVARLCNAKSVLHVCLRNYVMPAISGTDPSQRDGSPQPPSRKQLLRVYTPQAIEREFSPALL